MNQIYGMLFDGAWIWEEYVHLLIGSDFYHPMNKGGKGAQRLFEGNMFYCTSDPDFYMKALYGDTYMQLPPQEKRESHIFYSFSLAKE